MKLKSRKFWIALGIIAVGAVAIFIAALEPFEYLQASIPVIFGGTVTAATTYIGANIVQDWIYKDKDNEKK